MFRCHEDSSIFSLEDLAIREALGYTFDLNIRCTFIISDSKSVLHFLASGGRLRGHSPFYVKILNMVRLTKYLNIKFQQVHGYSGIPYYERIAEFATQSVTRETLLITVD